MIRARPLSFLYAIDDRVLVRGAGRGQVLEAESVGPVQLAASAG